jgi:hypothetical protein
LQQEGIKGYSSLAVSVPFCWRSLRWLRRFFGHPALAVTIDLAFTEANQANKAMDLGASMAGP